MARKDWLAATLAMATLATALPAWAQRVVVLRPRDADVTIGEAVNRLRGELGVHDFEVVVLDVASSSSSSNELASIAEHEHAVASISIVRGTGTTTADIWLNDRATGKTSMRTLRIDATEEAPRLLAIRAVDLLRVSLRELDSDTPPAPELIEAHPERATPQLRAFAAPVELPSRYELRADAAMMIPVSQPEPGFAAQVSARVWIGNRVGVGAMFVGPTRGTELRAPGVTARLDETLALAEIAFRFRSSPWSAELAAGAGIHHLGIEGSAEPPLVGVSSGIMSAAAAFGGGVDLYLSRHFGCGASLRAVLLAPLPVVELGEHAARLGAVVGMGTVGFRARF